MVEQAFDGAGALLVERVHDQLLTEYADLQAFCKATTGIEPV
jgi:hypothetical protein